MKSYLHGLTAKGAGSTIRPIVTPFYAASGEQEARALIEERPAHHSEGEAAPKPRHGGLASITGALDADSADLMQSATAAPYQRTSSKAAEERAVSAGDEAFVPLMGEVREERSQRPNKPAEDSSVESSPLQVGPLAEIRIERTLLPQKPLTIRPAQAMASRPAAQAHIEQPDQIEIHIGRIEVTAVTPPAAAAPRPHQKKSLDLGEYLKGRDGGAS